MFKRNGKMGRRDLFKTSAGVVGSALLSREAAAAQAPQRNVNSNSSPSALKITDLRVCTIVKPGPSPCPLIRIDTNQGVYGIGEVRDGASATYALFLKSRILNENPLNITYIWEKIKQFGGPSRQAGGVIAIEEALWDISGKVYNVPIYQMLGGKFRERIRIYADTDESPDPKVFAQRLKARKEEFGIAWLKMDVGINLVQRMGDTLTAPAEQTMWEPRSLHHPFVASEVTQKGIEKLCEYVQAAREAVGMEIPISMDHLGHLGVNSIVRLGKAYEKFNLAWMEDVIPWQYTDMLAHITAESPPPILTGEDIYLKEGFINLCEKHAVSKIHPDISTSGGILDPQDRRGGHGSRRSHGDAFMRARRSVAWQVYTWRPPPPWRWRTIRSTSPSGRIWWSASKSPSSTRAGSRYRTSLA